MTAARKDSTALVKCGYWSTPHPRSNVCLDPVEVEVKPTVARPHRIQRKRTRGWKLPPNTVYVGRPTIYGNPFKPHNGDCSHPDCGPKSHPPLTRQGAVEAYRLYLPGMLKVQEPHLFEWLRGKNLACWCALDQPCHADVLLEVVNA